MSRLVEKKLVVSYPDELSNGEREFKFLAWNTDVSEKMLRSDANQEFVVEESFSAKFYRRWDAVRIVGQ